MVAKSAHDRRYDYAHKQARKHWAPIVEQGGVKCHRCGRLIAPGAPWHLDHHDDGTGSSPSHARCNTATSKIWRDKALSKPAPAALGPCPPPARRHVFLCTGSGTFSNIYPPSRVN